MSSYSLAVDIGGTFTDVVLRASDGRLWVDKTLSTHRDLLEGFFTGVRQLLAKADIEPADVDGLVVHASTTVTNALIERRGPVTALLVTEGFRDVLTIREEHRYDIYDLQIEYSEPLIPMELTVGVNERVLADGSANDMVATVATALLYGRWPLEMDDQSTDKHSKTQTNWDDGSDCAEKLARRNCLVGTLSWLP